MCMEFLDSGAEGVVLPASNVFEHLFSSVGHTLQHRHRALTLENLEPLNFCSHEI